MEWIEQMNRGIRYIEQNLTGRVDPARLGPAFGRLLSSPVCTVGVCVATLLLLWWISRAKRGEVKRKEEDKE